MPDNGARRECSDAAQACSRGQCLIISFETRRPFAVALHIFDPYNIKIDNDYPNAGGDEETAGH